MPDDGATAELLLELLRRTHLSTAGDLPDLVAEQAGLIGGRHSSIHLIDYEQGTLVPLARRGQAPGEPLSVVGTVAGRAFSTTSILMAPGDRPGEQRLWLPLLDGTERVGIFGVSFDEEVTDRLVAICERYAHLVATLIVTKSAYSDVIERTRRLRPMTIASELAQSIAPPMVFATGGLALAGMLEPAYDNGGDALDYAVNDDTLHFAVFDAMGHGLAAAGVAAFAISAYRFSRRAGRDLLETYTAMDEAVGEQFPGSRYVTAVIAQLDRASGRLTWVSAGHPPPLLLRGGRNARSLELRPATPLGVESPNGAPEVGQVSLEPGDLLLLYTDGLTEARGPDGRLLDVAGLSAFIEREAAAGHAGPETLRRLRQAVLSSERAQLRDDATALLVEWGRDSEPDMLPQTVL
jgi:serine/threonine protein phosphatase PrpC